VEPASDVEVQAGKKIAVSASATDADGYRWRLDGDGEISATEGDTILYTAPEQEQVGEDGAMALLSVVAYNAQGESPQTSLVVNVIPAPLAPTIEITSPLTQVVCPLNDECHYNVMGTSSGVATDPNSEVVIFVKDGELWWPFRTVFVQSDGSWQDNVQIGDKPCWPAGYPFEIVAVVMGREQADSLKMEFQMLPSQYIARSNSVRLVTAHDESISIDLSWTVPGYDNNKSDVITLTQKGPSYLTFDYDLKSDGWVQAGIPVNGDWSCVKNAGYALAFSLEGTGNANTIEIKLEDQDGTHFGWLEPRASLTQGPKQIGLPLDNFSFWWPEGHEDMDWVQVKNLYFAISKKEGDEGGAGQVTIRDVALVPLVSLDKNQ
jgi:hypothetical protein